MHGDDIFRVVNTNLVARKFAALEMQSDVIGSANEDNLEHLRLRDSFNSRIDMSFCALIAPRNIEGDANWLAPLLEFLFPARSPAGCVELYPARPTSPCPWISS